MFYSAERALTKMASNSTFNSTITSPPSAFNAPPLTPEYLAEDNSHKLLAAAISVMVLSAITVVLRCITHIVHHSPWGLDDFLLAPALLTLLATCSICVVQSTAGGVGRHVLYLVQYNPSGLSIFTRTGYATEILYALTVAFSKLSILAFYLRIFTPGSTANIPGRYFRVTVYMTGFVLSATALACIVTSLVSCRPLAARWNPTMSQSSCINLGAYWFSTGVPNVLTDVIMLVLPLPGIWRLKLSHGKRLGLMGVFMLGSLGLIASITRLCVIFSTVISPKRSADLFDGTWDAVDVAFWSMIEAGSYISAACLPTLRPLMMDGVQFVKKAKTAFRGKVRRQGDFEDCHGSVRAERVDGHTARLGVGIGSQTTILGTGTRISAHSPITDVCSFADTNASGEVYPIAHGVEEHTASGSPQLVPSLRSLQPFIDFSFGLEGNLEPVVETDPRRMATEKAMAKSNEGSGDALSLDGALRDSDSGSIVDYGFEADAQFARQWFGTEGVERRSILRISTVSTYVNNQPDIHGTMMSMLEGRKLGTR